MTIIPIFTIHLKLITAHEKIFYDVRYADIQWDISIRPEQDYFGQVRDAQGNPAKFVTITESGTTNATTTDDNGNFSIKVKQSAATLEVSVLI